MAVTRGNAKNGPKSGPVFQEGPGQVELAVAQALADLPPGNEAHPILVATALTLARKLDEGAGLATAAVARELRCTVDALMKTGEEGDDELTGFVASLSSPMGVPPYS